MNEISMLILGFIIGASVMGIWAGRTIKRLRSAYDEALEQDFKKRERLFDENQMLRRKVKG